MGVETAVLALIGASAAISSSVGAYSSIQQGNFQNSAAQQQAAEMELQVESMKTQRAGERIDESNQQLERARQLDNLFREQRVAAASSGLMGESFKAIQANDLSAYTREQNLTSLFTSSRESNASLQLDSMKRQISATRASGNFAQQMGILSASGGLLSTVTSLSMGGLNYAAARGVFDKKKENNKAKPTS
jgi:hypothetical protein